MLETIAAVLATGTSLVSIAKGATDTAKDIQALVDKPDIDTTTTKQLVTQLLDSLIRLQAEQITMQSALLQLDKEQHRIDRFQAEAVRYALTRTEQGALVYELNPSKANGQPAHCICATCYEKHIKSILQPVERNTLGCNVCGGRFLKSDGQGSGIILGRIRTGWDVNDPYADD